MITVPARFQSVSDKAGVETATGADDQAAIPLSADSDRPAAGRDAQRNDIQDQRVGRADG